jgi:hypothetical protein
MGSLIPWRDAAGPPTVVRFWKSPDDRSCRVQRRSVASQQEQAIETSFAPVRMICGQPEPGWRGLLMNSKGV